MIISDKKTLAGGLVLVAFAILYGYFASKLGLYSSLGIGSGAFPVALSIILGLLGLMLTLQGLRSVQVVPIPSFAWRGLLLITLAPLAFALLVRPFGAVPALGVAVLLGSMGSRESTVTSAITATVVLVAVSALIFGWGLGIRLQLFGPWLGFS